jgi:hypothetical protein
MSSRKKKTITLPAFKLKWDDESILEEDDAIAENVRKLKRHQSTLKKGAKGYKDIAEHLNDIKAIKGNDVNILTNSNNSNNNATPPPKKSASRKKKTPSPNSNSPPAFRATRKKADVSPPSPPKPKKGLVKLSGLASFFMGTPPPKVTLPPSPPRASTSKAPPPKASASKAPPPKASASKAPSKAAAKPPAPRSPETVRRNAIEAARAYAHRRIPRHTKRRPGSNEAFIPAAPSGSSASPESPEYDIEFPDIIRAPHEPHEPITPAHCGRLDIAFIDDWIAGSVRALRIRGPPEDMPQRSRISFRSIGVDQKYDHVDNSADGTCLIHAFLTAVSAFYRNLSNVNKGILGRAFRRNIYARLWSPDARINIDPSDYRAVPKRLHLGRKRQVIRRPSGSQRLGDQHDVPRRRYTEYVGGIGEGRHHGYLYDSDAEKLAQCFNVNILLVPPEILNIRYYEDDSVAGRAKPNIIIRQSGQHFTTLHLGEQFIFSREEILPIVEGVNAARNANAAGLSVADRAKFAAGKRVFVVGHPGEERIIQEYVWSNAGAPRGHAVRVSHVILESGDPRGERVPVANIRFP